MEVIKFKNGTYFHLPAIKQEGGKYCGSIQAKNSQIEIVKQGLPTCPRCLVCMEKYKRL